MACRTASTACTERVENSTLSRRLDIHVFTLTLRIGIDICMTKALGCILQGRAVGGSSRHAKMDRIG